MAPGATAFFARLASPRSLRSERWAAYSSRVRFFFACFLGFASCFAARCLLVAITRLVGLRIDPRVQTLDAIFTKHPKGAVLVNEKHQVALDEVDFDARREEFILPTVVGDDGEVLQHSTVPVVERRGLRSPIPAPSFSIMAAFTKSRMSS